jgi:hypothetical protein
VLLLMVIAAVVSVTQLAVLGSWGRSLRITTLLQGIAVGFLVCGFATVTIQFAWTRIAAALTSIPVYDIQRFAAWTVDPFIEEIFKVAPLLLLMWWRPRIQKQLGYTDHLLYGAALGMGFELLEAALRFARLGRMAGDYGGQFVVDGGLFGLVRVPNLWEALFTWQPAPVVIDEFLGSGDSSIQHLVWTALAGVGVAWFARWKGPRRLLGLLPLLLASLDHANYNMRIQIPDAGWGSDALAWVGSQLSWMLVVALLGAVAADRVIQVRGRRLSPAVLLPGEPPTPLNPLPVLRSAFGGFPWSTWVVWQVVLSRRAAMTALTAGETDPHLRDGVATEVATLSRAVGRSRRDAVQLWRDAVKRTFPKFDWRVLRSPKVIIWAVALLPAVAYLVIGAFPATMGLQQVMKSHVGLGLLVAGLLAGGVLTVMQFRPLWSELRIVVEPSLHERRLRLQARFATAVASLAGGLLMLGLAVVQRDPSASIVSTFHVLDAISDALLVLGLALIIGSFFIFPPFAVVGIVGGGAVLMPTVTGSFVIATAAGATIASLGVLMNESSSSGGSGGSGGNPPPRFTDNTRQSRTYGNSVSDIRGQANRYAERMRARGNEAVVPQVRTGKYGGADITVTVIRNGVVKHIRHFIVK